MANYRRPGSIQKYGQLVIDNLRFAVVFIVPLLLMIVVFPLILNPDTVENFQINFKIVLLSKPFCEVKYSECKKLLHPDYGDPLLLKKTAFKDYDLIYIRHFIIDYIDNFVLRIIDIPGVKGTLIMLNNPENPVEWWPKVREAFHVLLAIGNSMLFHTIRGLLMSKMWVFFIFGTITTMYESWSSLLTSVSLVLRSDNTIF